MSDHLTIDVIDRPAGGVLHATRRLRTLRRRDVLGLRALLPLGTQRLVARTLPALTPRRIGVLAVWDGDADVEEGWTWLLSGLCADAAEHWHVTGEATRATFSQPWLGWMPDTEGAEPLDDDEPALVLISGMLRARHLAGFAKDAGRATAHAQEEPGYLGGLGLATRPLNTTSCSAWATYADARRYAYGSGRHAEAMYRDRAAERHATEWFLRVRPLAERGTLDGAAPFAGLVPASAARALA